jgi:hypothetical protein
VNPRSTEDLKGAPSSQQRAEKVVSQLVLLSRSEEACKLLGVEGVLAGHVDITILDDPLAYLAHDIAAAVRDAEDRAPVQTTMLSTLVAEFRLCSFISSHIDQHDLVERVMRQLRELQG